jgi:hypothetical protein
MIEPHTIKVRPFELLYHLDLIDLVGGIRDGQIARLAPNFFIFRGHAESLSSGVIGRRVRECYSWDRGWIRGA